MSDLARGSVGGLPFLRVQGRTPVAGWGPRLYTYCVYVEREIGPKLAFAEAVDETLADHRGWIRGGRVAFQRLPVAGATQVVLATPDTVDRLCHPLETKGEVSCCWGTRVVINAERWFRGVPHWTGTLRTYRQMVINHEWGHRQGHGHAYCPGEGKRSPVMAQQTYGLQGCRRNSWPLASEL